MKTADEIRKYIMQGRDDELSKEEMKLFNEELESLYKMIDNTDKLLGRTSSNKKNKEDRIRELDVKVV